MLSSKLERWIEHEQRHGRLEHADTSFICSTDDAIEQMFGPPSDDPGTAQIAAIAWELIRPNDEVASQDLPTRLRTSLRFVRALRSGGATETAERVRTYFHRHANPERVHHELTAYGYTRTLERTRTGYGRLATTTREAKQEVLGAARPDWPNMPNQWNRS